MKVAIKKKDNGNGKSSLYLQYNNQKEYLGLTVFTKPNAEQKAYNEKIMREAETQRLKVVLEQSRSIGILSADMTLMEYVSGVSAIYTKKDARKWVSMETHLRKFLTDRKLLTLKCDNLTTGICEQFGEYLKDDCGLTGETPIMYFRIFKSCLKKARKAKLIDVQIGDIDVKFRLDNTIRKSILTPDEVQRIASCETEAVEVKKAFLFSINTGVDFATVSRLTWSNVIDGELVFDRPKTKGRVSVQLNKSAKAMIGKRDKPDVLLFRLPTWEGSVKSLRKMARRLGIEKKLTWHSARHTFGYNAINYYKIPIEVVGAILGHTNLKTTMRYTRVSSQTKADAVNRLPDLRVG